MILTGPVPSDRPNDSEGSRTVFPNKLTLNKNTHGNAITNDGNASSSNLTNQTNNHPSTSVAATGTRNVLTNGPSTSTSQPFTSTTHPSPSTSQLAGGSSQLYKVVFPPKVTSIGRPKGSGQTAIGLKRKNKTKNAKTVVPVKKSKEGTMVNPKKFVDFDFNEQGLTIIGWLTNKSFDQVIKKKAAIGDIIQDANMFNRLRNDGIDLRCIKKYTDPQCYKYLQEEVAKLEDERWACTKCKRNLSGFQLMCNSCLDWFHIDCVNISKEKAKTITFFCSKCVNI